VWDLHYAKPTGSKDDDSLSGVWAPPGRYTVELTAAGQVLRQPLTIVADPRVKVSQADFEAQFRLARQIELARVRVLSMLEQATEFKSGLGKLKGKPAAEALNAELDQLVGEAKPIGGATAPTSLTSVSEWLDSLAQAVDGADGAPTPDNLRGFAVVSSAMDSLEPRWRAFAVRARASVPVSR
jgi:hypothetical protein